MQPVLCYEITIHVFEHDIEIIEINFQQCQRGVNESIRSYMKYTMRGGFIP